jgi:predicted nucleotide-binding protein
VQKTKYYYKTRFSPDVLQEAYTLFLSTVKGKPNNSPFELRVKTQNETWTLDTLEEFLSDSRAAMSFRLDHFHGGSRLMVDVEESQSYVLVKSSSRADIEAVFNVFERNVDTSKIIATPTPIRVFIGHGRDSQWRDLKDHLREQHGLHVEAYEIGPRAGRSVKDVLEDMLDTSSFALLVLTGEDEHVDGAVHARQNVVHELGLFQGRLGFTRAIVLLEDGVQEFSNILGVNQIRFSKARIRETFGDVVATIRREFHSA